MDMEKFNAAAKRVRAAEIELEAASAAEKDLQQRWKEARVELNAANNALSDIVGHAVKSAALM